MTVYDQEGHWRIKKFCLDVEEDKAEYEKILNDSSCNVKRDDVYHSPKTGQTFITIWYLKEEE